MPPQIEVKKVGSSSPLHVILSNLNLPDVRDHGTKATLSPLGKV